MTLLLILHGAPAIVTSIPSGTGGVQVITTQRARGIDAQPLADIDGQANNTVSAQPTETVKTQRKRNIRS